MFFACKAALTCRLKIDRNNCFGKSFKVFRSKGTGNGFKIKFFRYYQKSVRGTFLLFA